MKKLKKYFGITLQSLTNNSVVLVLIKDDMSIKINVTSTMKRRSYSTKSVLVSELTTQ
jgi:hypothetical protein